MFPVLLIAFLPDSSAFFRDSNLIVQRQSLWKQYNGSQQ
jgi:hypothetical protein